MIYYTYNEKLLYILSRLRQFGFVIIWWLHEEITMKGTLAWANVEIECFRAHCQPLCHLFGWWSYSWTFSTRRCIHHSWCIHSYSKLIATYAEIRTRDWYDCTPGKAISAKQGPHLLNSQDKRAHSARRKQIFRGTWCNNRETIIKYFIIYREENFTQSRKLFLYYFCQFCKNVKEINAIVL